MLSVVIPSRVPTYLQPTIDDLLNKADDEIEIIVVLDGYWPENPIRNDERVIVVHQGTEDHNPGMRAAINRGMSIASGDYLMKIDEHCMFDQGYDVKLAESCQRDSLIVPRRYRFDPDKWELIFDGRPPIDYMFLSRNHGYLHGWVWHSMNDMEDKKEILIDDVMTIQGSCWFIHKDLWRWLIGPLDDLNYGPFSNEGQEVSLKVWLGGGRCVVNKKTWYAHFHKPGSKSGYGFSRQQYQDHKDGIEKGRKYCTEFWMNNRWKKRVRDLSWLVDKFAPVPTWQ